MSRPRLLQRLDDGHRTGLTLLSAPAGSGKSTLLYEWCARQGRNVAWVLLSTGDNDPSSFWAYLVAAIRQCDERFRRNLEPLLSSHAGLSLDNLTTAMVNRLNDLRGELTVVLDNVQVLDAQEVQASLAALVEHLPPHVHLVLSSRVDPSLPLSRLLGQGRLVEIRGADLAFTVQECDELLNEMVQLGLSPRAVETLHARTEGWAVGLRLAANALIRSADVLDASSFGGSHPSLLDYFTDEVLSTLPTDLCTFLIETSVAESLCASLCEAITGQDHGQALLRRLRRANLFLIPLDHQARWYRYHHCFAEVLARRLEEKGPEHIKELHERAMRWYVQRGLMREAIHHALAAGNFGAAADIIEAQVDEIIWERGEMAELLTWLAALPPDVLRARPRLSLARAWALALTGQLQALEEHLTVAEQSVRLGIDASTEGGNMLPGGQLSQGTLSEIAAVRAVAAGSQIDTERLATWSREAVARAPDSGFLHSVLALSRGRACDLAADVSGAVEAYADARGLSESIGNTHIFAVATSRLAELWALQGELHHAAETHRYVLRLADDEPDRQAAVGAMAHVGLGGLHYEWNDLQAARSHFEKGMRRAASWGHLETLKGAYFGLARVRFARGNADEALELLREAETLARHSRAPRSIPWIHAMQARMNLALGNVKAAVRWAQTSPLRPEREPLRLFTGEYSTLVRLLIAQRQYDQALGLLEGLLQTATAERWVGLTIELLILQALAWQARGSIRPALLPLRKALALAMAERYVRTFVDEGAALGTLLERASSHSVMPAYLDVVIAAFSEGVVNSRAVSSTAVLTPRELEVLTHIAAGESNREIAQLLVVTLPTVKRHVSNIFDKLGVTSRTQAIARARQRGIL